VSISYYPILNAAQLSGTLLGQCEGKRSLFAKPESSPRTHFVKSTKGADTPV